MTAEALLESLGYAGHQATAIAALVAELKAGRVDTKLVDMMDREGWTLLDNDYDCADLHALEIPLRDALTEHCERWGIEV